MLSKTTINFTAQSALTGPDEGYKPNTQAGQHQPRRWQTGRFAWPVAPDSPVLVMGIVNVTPDSFSDGGQHDSTRAAIHHAEQLALEGAHILDIGGESTRPGAPDVGVDEELARVLPVITELVRGGHCVSVDTRKAAVMRAAIAAGASVVNDVTALAAPGSMAVCAGSDVGVVLMHMQGQPGTMQVQPTYDDVVNEVGDFLAARATACENAGIARDRIALDPGFGFGKNLDHNVALTRHLDQLVARGYPVLTGWSRKKTLGTLTGRGVAAERVHASVAAALACVAQGARIVRVHDVAATAEALKVWRVFTG